ncbi:MAG: hypothetical protein JSV77_02050 [Dehalococcoidales bacterium]|nr:MAG: hypothetical protein JSV77_02050 [Dehalococcoidales bacterium]
MIKVKTFTSPLKVFHTKQELGQMDEQVNTFLSEKAGRKVISVSDTCTTDDNGATIGIIRVVAYEETA